jgi:hypothetical protein
MSKEGKLGGAGGEKAREMFGGPAPVNETTASGLVRRGRMKKRMTVEEKVPTEQQ